MEPAFPCLISIYAIATLPSLLALAPKTENTSALNFYRKFLGCSIKKKSSSLGIEPPDAGPLQPGDPIAASGIAVGGPIPVAI